ncbi:MAG: dynamin family protein, partial [Prevotella sp.]|nr:dynamin family protein [Prevotella sp.]
MTLVKKTNSKNASSTSKKQIIKVNPYENAENVMSIMASICSAKPSTDIDLFWEIIDDAFDKVVHGKSLSEYIQENRYNLYNKDFNYDLKSFCRELAVNLETRENTQHTQIVVAGGFSSGKSSFLNRLTDCATLLPTGVEPVSVVKTYLYCSRNTNSISVKGVNHKNAVVNLNTNVLQAIQHAKKSNVYLASVLDKLFIEIPSKKLDGLVFIDTLTYTRKSCHFRSPKRSDN